MSTPGNLLSWDLTKEDLITKTNELINSSKILYDSIGDLKPENVTYDNVIKALADHDSESTYKRNKIDFLQHVSSDKEIRDVSVESDKKLSKFEVEMSMREDVFKNLIVVEKIKREWSSEERRFIERLIKLGRHNGLHLSQEKQNEIKSIKKRISELGIDFSKNLNEEDTIFEFTQEELVGLPESFMEGLKKTPSNKYKISLKYPDYFPCQKFARNPETREKLEVAFNSRCIKENTSILEELISLRKKKAEILNFASHADLVLDMRMAKNPSTVKTFLKDLMTKLKPLKDKETKIFLEYKEKEHKKYNMPYDGKLRMSDYRYYMTRVEETMYSFDQNKMKEYFPLHTVTEGLLKIYQNLLGLKYEKIENPSTWHSEVDLYSVTDAESNKLIGYFYLDIFPRQGKFGHAACFGLQPGCKNRNGDRQVAVAAMVANFTKPTDDKPSLLSHDEVETYFHEFGHVMHQICSETDFSLFSGTNVERDFVEAPSQMLENWAWQEQSLRLLSKHYKDGSPIPKDLMNALLNSRQANTGLFNLRQILLSSFDQTIHTSKDDKIDTAALFDKLSLDFLGIPSSKGTNMAASFGHLAGGYDAQYYGYMWSEVFSVDMFMSRFNDNNQILSPEVGMSYRKCILKPGGSIDASELLRNFLGREPNQDAFLKMKGLST